MLNKLLVAVLICVSCCGQELPQGRSAVAPYTVAPAGPCATSDTSIPHDELLEGFETATTGYENTWAETGTTANITAAGDSSALSTGKPTGACNQAWKIVAPTDGTETFARWDRGSSIDVDTQAVDIVFYLYVETAPDSGEGYRIFTAGNSTAPSASITADVLLVNTAGTLQIRGNGSTSSTLVNCSVGSWHKIDLHIDTTTAGSLSTFTLDGGSASGFNRSANDLRYVSIGPTVGLDVNDSGTIWLDVICVNTP